jgi:hypothetical protein
VKVLESYLNPNLVERIKQSGILSSVEWISCCIYIACRILYCERNSSNHSIELGQESILSLSEKFALNKVVTSQIPAEIQAIFPVIDRTKTLLQKLIQMPLPMAVSTLAMTHYFRMTYIYARISQRISSLLSSGIMGMR